MIAQLFTRTVAAALLLLMGTSDAFAFANQQSVDGIWDLTWQTRRGPSQSGYIVMSHTGRSIFGEIRGKGTIKASGTEWGNSFRLSGTKMIVRYDLLGTWAGDRMQGKLKVLTLEKQFTGKRRTAR